jgi:peptidyl-prolyl cis-trans isomerase SurA
VLVVVNDEVIVESELKARLEEVRTRIAAQKIQAPPENVFIKQVLDRLVVEHLQQQLAKKAGIDVTDAQLETALGSIAQQNHLSVPDLYATLEKEGTSRAQFRAQVRSQIATQQLLEREIGNRVFVSDAEVENFLANQENRDGGTEYNISHILISLPESASPEIIQETAARAQALQKSLRDGADFGQAAVANSQGQNALEGGNLGWKKSGQLPTLFLNAARNMQPGEVSDVLRSPGGFHILKLVDKRGGKRSVTVKQTHARHILINTNEIVSADDAQRRLAQLRQRIDNGEDFAKLAKSNSEDTASAANGGDLGWVNPGQTVPEFEQAMNALKPNEISKPVRTPYGYHLIQVLERRERDITDERDRADARQQIHERKSDERYEQWLRQLRDEAYVEYHTSVE